MKRELFAVLAALALAYPGAGAEAQDRISFRLDYSIYGTHAPFFLAIDEGLYQAEGIEVVLGEGSGSGNTAQLLAQGNDPIGFMDYGTMVSGIAAGMPLKAVFGVHQRSPMIIISHADAPVESPTDLEGRILAMSPAESTARMFPVLAGIAGADVGKISVIAPAVGAKTALFLQRRTDAITGTSYFHIPTLEAQGADVSYFSYADFGVSALEGGVVANTAWLEANPELAARFIKVTQDAFLSAKADPEAAVDALLRQRPDLSRNRDLLIRQLELSMEETSTTNTEGLSFGTMSAQDWETMIDQFLDSGQISERLPAERLFTNDFVPE